MKYALIYIYRYRIQRYTDTIFKGNNSIKYNKINNLLQVNLAEREHHNTSKDVQAIIRLRQIAESSCLSSSLHTLQSAYILLA